MTPLRSKSRAPRRDRADRLQRYRPTARADAEVAILLPVNRGFSAFAAGTRRGWYYLSNALK